MAKKEVKTDLWVYELLKDAGIKLDPRGSKNDPLFKQIPVISAKKCLNQIVKLPLGKTDNADKKFESNCTKLFASLLHPHLDFAQA